MGKLKGAVKFTGKLNDVVGYKVGNALNESYGVRNRQTTVSNPKSVAQAKQRMKTVAALNFYKAFAEILDHSWEGIKYGARSYSEFLKRAMLLESGYPFQSKGSKKFVPGEFAVADGSLTPVTVTVTGTMNKTNLLITEETIFNSGKTIGQISTELINNNAFLQDGDQITMLCVYDIADSGIYIPLISRFVLNVDSAALIDQWDENQPINMSIASGSENSTVMAFFPRRLQGTVIAGALIISRPPRNVGGAWRRSPATMACSQDFKNVWMGNQRYMIAEHSFTAKQATVGSSPYYLNQGNYGDNNGSTTVQRSIVNAQSDITGQSSAFLVENGVSRLIVAKNSSSARVINYYEFDGVSNLAPVSVTEAINYDENTMVLIGTVQSYFPDITTNTGGGGGGTIEDRP